MTTTCRAPSSARATGSTAAGKGAVLQVWLAIEKGTGKKVAVKILSLKHLPRAMVEQEVTAMRRCG